jgi:hypothetical protein
MADLTETEILDCMRHNLTLAAQHAEALALQPKQGPNFERLRAELRLVEGCCRQMSAWREDTRWLPIGLMMEECHQRARRWIVSRTARQSFLKLAENLRALLASCQRLETAATGRVGMILPDAPVPFRENRLVQVVRPSGLILP